MTKILFTSPILEYPAAGGPQLRMESSVKALATNSQLYIVSRVNRENLGGSEAESVYKSLCSEFFYSPSAGILSENILLRLVQKVNRQLLSSDSDFIIRIADKFKINIIWFGYGLISYPLIKEVKAKKPGLKIICDTDSVWSRFVLRRIPYESDPAIKEKIRFDGNAKKAEEREWVNLCDVTTAVSEVDAGYYKKLARNPDSVKLFSNVIDLKKYDESVPVVEGIRMPYIYFAGTFGPKSPTDYAVRWFIRKVYPIVKKYIPGISFYIVGTGADLTLNDIRDTSISVIGKLKSVLPYLCHADVAVVPLKFESGTRFKILEAAACGIPIVSTPLGAEGIPVKDGENMVIADRPEEFAAGIIKIIRDKKFADKLKKNCRRLVEKNYGLGILTNQAKEIINYLED